MGESTDLGPSRHVPTHISLVTHVVCFCVSIRLRRAPFEKRPKCDRKRIRFGKEHPVEREWSRREEEKKKGQKIKAGSSGSASAGLLARLKGVLQLPCLYHVCKYVPTYVRGAP